jgi:hypothetical protein
VLYPMMNPNILTPTAATDQIVPKEMNNPVKLIHTTNLITTTSSLFFFCSVVYMLNAILHISLRGQHCGSHHPEVVYVLAKYDILH